MTHLVLSLFPGIGLFDRAFEAEGFCVVRGPDLIWGGDVRKFHPPSGRFDGVIGGPPCQLFSILKRLNPKAGEKHGNLIPEFERVVREAQPMWFVMENVPAAPIPVVDGYITQSEVVFDGEVGGVTTRTRRFTLGENAAYKRRDWIIDRLALWRTDLQPAVLAGGGGRSVPVAIGGSGKRKKSADGHLTGPSAGPRISIAAMLESQGLPPDAFDECPLTVDGLRHAVGNGVPLAMGRAVARAVMRLVQSEAA